MKRALLVVGIVLSVAILSFPQDASIYREAGVVPFFSQSLRLGTDQGLNFETTEFGESFSFDLNGQYYLDHQSLNWNIYISDYLDLTLPEEMDQGMFTNDSSVSVTRYFTNLIPVPIQVFGEGYVQSRLQQSDVSVVDYASWSAGIGLGRIVDVRPVARILAVAEKLGADFSTEQILDASSIVAKSSEYMYRHRGHFDEEYYGEIAGVLGLSDEVLSVQRALWDTSTISERNVGWSTRVAFRQSYDGEQRSIPHLRLSGDLGVPIGLNMQLSPWLRSSVYFDGLYVDATLGTRYAVDHSTNWASSVGGAATVDSDSRLSYGLSASTRILLIDRLYAWFGLAYSAGTDFSDTFFLNLYFWYYLL